MITWNVTPVGDNPEVVLRDWSIRQLNDGSRFVTGCQSNLETRVFGPVVEFDLKTMRGRTDLGRVFEITGEDGSNARVEAHWDFFCELKGIAASIKVDVTEIFGPDAKIRLRSDFSKVA